MTYIKTVKQLDVIRSYNVQLFGVDSNGNLRGGGPPGINETIHSSGAQRYKIKYYEIISDELFET